MKGWIFAAAEIAHLSDDETVAKMGHPGFWGMWSGLGDLDFGGFVQEVEAVGGPVPVFGVGDEAPGDWVAFHFMYEPSAWASLFDLYPSNAPNSD